MPSSVKADLLDDGIVDTLVSVGATRLDNAAADPTDPHKRTSVNYHNRSD
jgi:hypothetical protein